MQSKEFDLQYQRDKIELENLKSKKSMFKSMLDDVETKMSELKVDLDQREKNVKEGNKKTEQASGTQYTTYNTKTGLESTIIKDLHVREKLLDMLPQFADSINLEYKAFFDGWEASKFHACCDNKGPTLSVFKTDTGHIFGAFTDIPWETPDEKRQKRGNGNSFIFKFDGQRTLEKFKCLKSDHEVYHCPNALTVFGNGHYLHIDQNQTGSFFTQSNSFEQPTSENPNSYFAGAKNFKLVDIEVFSIEFKK